MADVPAGFEVVKTASGAPPGFEVVKPGASASAPAPAPSGDGRIHLGTAQDSEHMTTPEYMIDQIDRAPFKALDFLLHGVSGGSEADKFKLMTPEQQQAYLKAFPKAAEKINDPLKDPVNFGSRLAEKLLGPEPKPSGPLQAIVGAGAGAIAGGGPGGLKNIAASGAIGGAQEAAVQGLTALGVSPEKANAIVMMLGLGGSVAAGRATNAIGKDAAERAAVEKTKDYVAQREAVNATATDKASAQAAQDAMKAAQKDAMATFEARQNAADAIQRAADRHVENTIATFQPNSTLGEIGQASLSKLNDTVREQVKAQAQGTLQKVTDTKRVDVSQALALAKDYERKFAGRESVAGSAGGVADNILSNTKENLGKTSAPVGGGKISSTLRNKITTDTATMDGATVHNIIGDINDRIEGKGKYATEKTPDVGNLLAIKKALIQAVDKSSDGAYSKYLSDYAAGMAKLDPFQRGQAADKLTADMDYGRSKVMGPGQAAETLLPKGMKGGDTAARIQTLMGDNPEFQQAVKSYVGQKLSDLKASPGGLTPQKIAQFQREYGPAMKAYGVDISSVQDAVQAAAVREAEVSAIRKATETQRDKYNNSALGRAAGVADASMVLDPIMQGDRSARLSNMRQTVQAIQRSPQAAAAMDGLRSKFNQYFFDHPEQSADMALMAEKSGLYTPEQAANIRKVADSIRGEGAQQQAARMVRGGMPALENSSSVANYIVRKVGFIALSSGVGTIAGGPVAGAATGAAALMGQSMIARQKQMTIDAVAKIIQDPKMARIMAEKPNKANAFVADTIARQIAAEITRQHPGQQDQQQ